MIKIPGKVVLRTNRVRSRSPFLENKEKDKFEKIHRPRLSVTEPTPTGPIGIGYWIIEDDFVVQ